MDPKRSKFKLNDKQIRDTYASQKPHDVIKLRNKTHEIVHEVNSI